MNKTLIMSQKVFKKIHSSLLSANYVHTAVTSKKRQSKWMTQLTLATNTRVTRGPFIHKDSKNCGLRPYVFPHFCPPPLTAAASAGASDGDGSHLPLGSSLILPPPAPPPPPPPPLLPIPPPAPPPPFCGRPYLSRSTSKSYKEKNNK